MSITYFYVIGLAIVALYCWKQFHTRSKRTQHWIDIARRLELTHVNGVISGTLRGSPLRVWQEIRGVGRSRHWTLCMRSPLTGTFPGGLELRNEGITQKLSKLVGAQDVQLGLPDIDKKVMVKANSEREVREWARDPGVALGLERLAALKRVDIFRVDSGELYIESTWAMDDPELMGSLIRQLASVSADLSTRLEEPEASPLAPSTAARPVEPIEIPAEDQTW